MGTLIVIQDLWDIHNHLPTIWALFFIMHKGSTCAARYVKCRICFVLYDASFELLIHYFISIRIKKSRNRQLSVFSTNE